MEVVIQLLRNVVDDLLCLHTIASLIKRRCKYSYCTFSGSHCNNSAADAALRRETYVPRPSSRAVIETRHSHRAEDVRDVFLLDDTLTCTRVNTVVRKRRPHSRKLNSVDADRALFGIDIHRLEWISVDAVVLGKQIGQCFVTGVCSCLGLIHFIDQLQLFSGSLAVEVEYLIPLFIFVPPRDEACRCDRAGIHERVTGMSGHIYDCDRRIERPPSRLRPYLLEYRIGSQLVHCQGERVHLGYGLDGERVLDITD